jgi:hypothetical protein
MNPIFFTRCQTPINKKIEIENEAKRIDSLPVVQFNFAVLNIKKTCCLKFLIDNIFF